jgi:hypothetical protein
MKRRNILVVYSAYPTRATLQDALRAFGRYAHDRVCYLNVRARGVPAYVQSVPWDLVIFSTLFFPARHDADAFRRVMRRVAPLARLGAHKAIIPQDEFINGDVVNEFIEEFGINTVFSSQPPRAWRAIYGPAQDRSGVRVVQVLTGYLDDERVQRIERFRAANPERPIDIGYRTGGQPVAWWGRHGFAKTEIAEVFRARAQDYPLRIDISDRAQDTLHGDRWYEFLCRCKYQLGVEGGTSINDRDGTIKARTEAYLAAHPGASFEEVEAACFPGVDGSFSGFAISPRHLEACAAGTCQVLVEGEYNGILRAGVHYIPVKRDWSNVDEVLALISSDELRAAMVERAYRDIVASGEFTYRRFVEIVIENTIGLAGPALERAPAYDRSTAVQAWMDGVERFDRSLSKFYGTAVVPLRQRLRRR